MSVKKSKQQQFIEDGEQGKVAILRSKNIQLVRRTGFAIITKPIVKDFIEGEEIVKGTEERNCIKRGKKRSYTSTTEQDAPPPEGPQ